MFSVLKCDPSLSRYPNKVKHTWQNGEKLRVHDPMQLWQYIRDKNELFSDNKTRGKVK